MIFTTRSYMSFSLYCSVYRQWLIFTIYLALPDIHSVSNVLMKKISMEIGKTKNNKHAGGAKSTCFNFKEEMSMLKQVTISKEVRRSIRKENVKKSIIFGSIFYLVCIAFACQMYSYRIEYLETDNEEYFNMFSLYFGLLILSGAVTLYYIDGFVRNIFKLKYNK